MRAVMRRACPLQMPSSSRSSSRSSPTPCPPPTSRETKPPSESVAALPVLLRWQAPRSRDDPGPPAHHAR